MEVDLTDRTQRVAEWLIVGIVVVVPFHAFLTVWSSTFVGHFTLLRLWDEAALFLVTCCTLVLLWRDAKLRQRCFQNPLVRLIGLYVAVTLLLGVVSLLRHEVVLKALAYAFIINLRFLLWTTAVWLIASRSGWLLRHWRKVVFIPLGIVVLFGLIQFFVLPKDFLMHFGYSSSHSSSYVDGLTLNQDSSILRVQSTLRGSNQLGGYLVACISLILLLLQSVRRTWQYWALGVLTLLTLLLTFSRSAWLGMLVSVGCLVGIRFRKIPRIYVWSALGVGVILVAGLIVFRDSNLVQNLILHKSSHSTAVSTSDQGHASALRSSLHDLVHQPFGAGPGTAGQASVYNAGHAARNTESYWLELGLEMGWPGLFLFGAILVALGRALWLRRTSSLALGLLIGLFGLVVVNFLAYGWVDDTLAYVWWGLVGIAVATKPPVVKLGGQSSQSKK